MNIIGKRYYPMDNSYCIDLHTGKKSLICQDFDTHYTKDKVGDEYGAEFTITKNPYINPVFSGIGNRELLETFVDVKSSLTGREYRVLYNEKRVI